MKLPGRMVAALLFGLAVGLMAFLPARVVGSLLAAASEGRLSLDQPEGTLWRGQGALYLRVGSAESALGQLAWRASAPGLLLGRLEIAGEQRLGDRPGRFNLQLRPGSVTFNQLDIGLPGAVLAGVSPLLAALQPVGRLGLRSEGFTFAHGRGTAGFSGALQIDWLPASFLGGVQAGDYRLNLQGDGNSPLQGKLVTLGGGLKVDGDLNLAGRAGAQLTAHVRLMPEADKARLMPVFRALCASGKEECFLPGGKR